MSFVLAACGTDSGASPNTPVTPTIPVTPVAVTPLRVLAETRGLHMGIGAAVGSLFNSTDPISPAYMKLVAQEYNVLTPENDMKFSSLHPNRATFNFARADSMVAFAKANNMKVRGHTLAWHTQIPSWVTNGTWTAAESKTLLDEHIAGVVGHYKGQLAAWDVVNEAFTDGPVALRGGFWADHIGRSYIEQAFRTAFATDPAVPLFYNDYSIEPRNPKSDSVYAMLADFKARGVPVSGIGMQMHLVVGALPNLASMSDNFARFAALGLRIHITELDLRMPVPSTAAAQAAQAQNYRDIYSLCLQQPACDMVVTWGVTDRASWVPGSFAGMGEALLFDTSLLPKSAYTAVNNLLSGK
jgi:endo-1,4-beta-xylanase